MTDPKKLLQLYDGDTGQETDESLMGAASEQDRKDIEEGDAYATMMKTRGWALLEDHLFTALENIKNTILDEQDIEKIRKSQAIGLAYSNVLGLVRHKVARAQEIRDMDPKG